LTFLISISGKKATRLLRECAGTTLRKPGYFCFLIVVDGRDIDVVFGMLIKLPECNFTRQRVVLVHSSVVQLQSLPASV
jgi:hypothetical protein